MDITPTGSGHPVLAPALDAATHSKIRRLFKSKQPDQVTLALNLLDSLAANPTDHEAVLTTAAGNYLRRLANEWFQDGISTRRDYLLYHGVLIRSRFLMDRAANGDATGFYLDLADIPAGAFRISQPAGASTGDAKEQPLVRLTKPFRMGRTVVTQGQWRAVMGTEPWRHTRYKNLPRNQCGDNFPVVYVNFEDAACFCDTLTELEQQAGRLAPAEAYRLPTEAEWEHACRAGTATRYSFGDDPRLLGAHGWFLGNSQGRLHEVAGKRPNPWGLYDMHGNVWEWCADWHDMPTGGIDSTGPAEGRLRVCRGGIWGSDATCCRSDHRIGVDPAYRRSLYGFRVVLAE